MDNDGSQCPENSNSTDYLLRTLLQLLKENREANDAEIDWDPISFAFTLLIGLVAILFALATIFQAIFAAGKGHRRTNRLAIGKWSEETSPKWDWSEMNYQFTATTPILREDSLPTKPDDKATDQETRYDADRDDSQQERAVATQEDGAQSGVDNTVPPLIAPQLESQGLWARARKLASILYPRQSQIKRSSAAWLEFFKEVGLDELNVEDWGKSKREVVADYLPDDLTAAPAYAQVGAIVAAAAVAGIKKVEIEKESSRNYPILVGQGFQVDFRQHPALGVVGAYSRYNDRSKQSETFNREEFRLAMQHGRGFVGGEHSMDLSTESTRRRLIERWSVLGKWHATRYRSSVKMFALSLSAISEAHLPLIVGLFADKPECVPALFPTATMGTNTCVTALALSGKYWAEVDLNQFTDSEILERCGNEAMPSWDGFIWPRFGKWEADSRSEKELYRKLDAGRGNSIDPWAKEIVAAEKAQLEVEQDYRINAEARLLTEQAKRGAEKKLQHIEEERDIDETRARMQAKQAEQGTEEKLRELEDQRRMNAAAAKMQAEQAKQGAEARLRELEGQRHIDAVAARLRAEQAKQEAKEKLQKLEDQRRINAAAARLQAEQAEQEAEEKLREVENQRRINVAAARLREQKNKQELEKKRRREEEQSLINEAAIRLLKERADASRARHENTAAAEAAGERLPAGNKEGAAEVEALQPAAIKGGIEVPDPIEEGPGNLDASVGKPKAEHGDITAGATNIGNYFVLQVCLDLFHEPALLQQSFSEASSDSLKFLRGLVHEQIGEVDDWLCRKDSKEGIRHRSILLCNTTIVLLRVQQMISSKSFNSPGPDKPLDHGVGCESVEKQKEQSSNRGRFEKSIVGGTHSNVLKELRNMADNLGSVENQRGTSELANMLDDSSDSSLLWDRLRDLVVYHSEKDLKSPLWEQHENERSNKMARDIDDVIIYRCLMMILLFRTAADSSEILKSGIWDQVVPII